MRSSSPPPQPPKGGRPSSPRDHSRGNSSGNHRFGRVVQEGTAGSHSEPGSPGQSPRQGDGRGRCQSSASSAAIAVYEECALVLSTPMEPPTMVTQESASERPGVVLANAHPARIIKGDRGGGSSRTHSNSGESNGRMEREHRELVRAFGEKCDQLRLAHASASGAELRLAQMAASGASEVMRQRLEAAEAASASAMREALADRKKCEDREAQLRKRYCLVGMRQTILSDASTRT
jgi:hypothetical protein